METMQVMNDREDLVDNITALAPRGGGKKLGRALRESDPRVKLLTSLVLGVCIWYSGTLGLVFFACMLAVLHLFFRAQDRLNWTLVLAGASFAFFWTLAACGMAYWEGAPLGAALQQGGVLGARLLLLLLLGLGVAMSSSTRQLGLAMAWGMRPLLRERAWQTALAMSLMVHYLPQTLNTLLAVKRMDRLRAPKRSVWVRLGLMAQTCLRVLAQNTWKQTVALAVRGQDAPEAWEADFTPQPLAWCMGGALTVLGLLAAFL